MRIGAWSIVALCFAGPALAQPVIISVADLPCLPEQGNAALHISVSPDVEQNAIRLFFRRQAHSDLYYLLMHPLGNGHYWAVLPKPEKQNEMVEYHIHIGGPAGETVASSPIRLVAVTKKCEAKLSDQEEDESDNLRVGETTADQKSRPVAWFLCDGIIQRIGIDGQVRPDDFCGVPPPPAPLVLGSVVGPLPAESPSRPEVD
jgi:hypothetical protein